MKKLLVILICSAILLPSLIAQETEIDKRGYIGLSMGPAIPLGQFSSTDASNDNIGYANTGFNLQLINFGYKFGKYLGISAMWSGSFFSIDGDAYLKDSGIEAFSIDATSYSFGSILGGIFVSVPYKRFEFDFRGMIGFGYGTSPEIKYNGYDINGDYAILKQSSANAMGFAFDLGIGARFNVSQLINLNIYTDYMGFSPEYTIDVYGNKTLLTSVDISQPMNHMTITGGFGFRLK